jgi:TRAP-type C4-dicarboxylate transport system substrate-binding protein
MLRMIGMYLATSFFFAVLNATTLLSAETAQKPVNIKIATYLTPANATYQPLEKFVDTINKMGAGKVTAELYGSGSLLKTAREHFAGLMSGAADAVYLATVTWHGIFPLSQGVSLPGLWGGQMDKYDKAFEPSSPLPKFLNENVFAAKNIFAFFGTCDNRQWLWTKNKPVKLPDDAKGLKLRSSGIIPSEVIARLGASPVTMDSGEIYLALKLGTVEGELASYISIESRSLHEQVNYMTPYLFATSGPMLIAFKKDWIEKQSKEVFEILKAAGEVYRQDMIIASSNETNKIIQKLSGKVTTLSLTKDSIEKFDSVVNPIYEWWVNRKEIGEPGKALLTIIKETEK